MTMRVTITQYDPATKQYTASLSVPDGEAEKTYTCQGTWDSKQAEMVARALHDQHERAAAQAASIAAEKQAIVDAIETELSKLTEARHG